jgi:ABC-type multidrug transport system ATPase subunit
MNQEVKPMLRSDSVMFEYDVHDKDRAIRWYMDMFGFEISYGPTSCHTEFALPLDGARLALSLADQADRPIKGFSGGERQRLGIVQAQVNYLNLLILADFH